MCVCVRVCVRMCVCVCVMSVCVTTAQYLWEGLTSFYFVNCSSVYMSGVMCVSVCVCAGTIFVGGT